MQAMRAQIVVAIAVVDPNDITAVVAHLAQLRFPISHYRRE
jgi:hypothetical protein